MILKKMSERRIALVAALLTKRHRAASNRSDGWRLNAKDVPIAATGGLPNRTSDEAG